MNVSHCILTLIKLINKVTIIIIIAKLQLLLSFLSIYSTFSKFHKVTETSIVFQRNCIVQILQTAFNTSWYLIGYSGR